VPSSEPLLSHPSAAPREIAVRRAPLCEIDPRTLYRILQLRERVFSMEQHATDEDLDGRELEDTTILVWLEEQAGDGRDGTARVIAQARVLADRDAMRIGRVVVAGDRRRGGQGRRLMRAALDVCREQGPGLEIRIDAQAYLEQWYASMGFETVGGIFLEAGIEHVAMVLRP